MIVVFSSESGKRLRYEEERRDDDEAVKKDKCSGEAGRHTRVTGFLS
jgi:hypothetical protein